jgi:hypothetical protein
MAIIYERTYRPVYLNVDAELLGRLDEYKSTAMPRSKHIHAALELYLDRHSPSRMPSRACWRCFASRSTLFGLLVPCPSIQHRT